MDEKKYSDQFVELFSPHFDLFPAVHMRHPVAGNDLVIDFIGFQKNQEIIGPIGFEIKDPMRWGGNSGRFGTFTDALAQSIDYQQRVINSQFKDSKYALYFNSRIRYTFLFPVESSWGYHFDRTELTANRLDHANDWAAGALRLSGKYGVGAACKTKYDWVLTLGCHPAFWLSSGPTPLFYKHAVNTRTGSAK